MSIRSSSAASRLFVSLSLAALSTTSATVAAELVGVAGFDLHRLDTNGGPSTLLGTATPVDPNEHSIVRLARAPDGTLYGLSTAQIGPVVNVIPSRVYRLDDQTGQATSLWPIGSVLPNGAAIHPQDGALWYSVLSSGPWGPNGPDVFLFRLDLATGTITSKGTFVAGNTFSFHGLAFDASGNLYTLNAFDTSLWSVDPNDAAGAGTAPIGVLGGGVDASAGVLLVEDPPTGTLFAFSRATGAWATVDVQTGAATATGTSTPGAPAISDLAGSTCAGSKLPYGAGCAGSGAAVPKLVLDGCPLAGAQIQLVYSGGLGGQPAALLLGFLKGQTPIGAGCDLLVQPLALVLPAFVLGGAGAGNGTATLPALVPLAASGVTVTLQGANADPAHANGFVVTNGVEVKIP